MTDAEKLIARCEAVLKPFADEANDVWIGAAGDHEPIVNFTGINLRVGDLRAAAELYVALKARSAT